jgi:AcrR family transcriptional regulator
MAAAKTKASQTNAQKSAATRAALIAAGTKLFAKHGYAGVSTEQLVRTAKVTRGALYHHFDDKKDLFRAVYEEVERDTVMKIAEMIAPTPDPWDVAINGSLAFLDLCLDPAFQQIAIVEATIAALIEAKQLEEQPVKPLARMLTGALIEGGVMIAGAEDEKAARRDVGRAVERILRGLAI